MTRPGLRHNPNPTAYAELNEVLRDLTERTAAILGDNFVGAYLQDSFAVGDADMHNDCGLIQQVRDDRRLGYDPAQAPRPGSVGRTLAFAEYVQGLAGAFERYGT